MKILLFLFLLSFGLLSAPAAPVSELDQLINGLQGKYLRLNTLSADFTQLYHAPGERARRESGRLQLKKPGKMRWDYATPEAKLYVSDGKVIYEYIPADRSATRASVKQTEDWRAPFMFLLGRGNLRRDFARIDLANEAPVCAGNRVLRMIPKRSSDIRELLVEVDPNNFNLARLSLLKSGQARIDFLLSNVQENIALADSMFTFQPPAGVAVRQQ
ncbi:MAG TPA: outer membrane lipoprotein chaperone LolA [Blastocatellia bacterium]|nr:outer membrane lipoprotein chaperone LolA [Blastocatellia bacterium]